MNGFVASRSERLRSAASWFGALLVFGGWLALVSWHRPAATYRRAELALDADRVEPLQYALLELRSHVDYEPQSALLTGKLLLAENRCDAALEWLEIAKRFPSTEVRALALGGEALYRTGRFTAAGEAWTLAIELSPRNADALRWLGIAYSDLGANHEARRYLQFAAEAAPDDPGPLRLEGLLAKEESAFEDAVTAFRESLRRDPDQTDANLIHLEIAECLYSLGKDEEALKALELCEPGSDALTIRAYANAHLGRTDEALRDCLQAVDMKPKQVKALLLEAKIRFERREHKAALACLEKVVAAEPARVEAWYQLAAVWQRLGRKDEAAEAGRKAAELTQLEERFANLRDKASLEPADVGLRLELGRITRQLHHFTDARRWYRSALYLDPSNQAAAESLRELLALSPPDARSSAAESLE
ncbi:MAG TPA: tetratricopeptide repeat protein [Pirellulales bacterium]|nr:tetratricopeptide repeat protein [Pirellulales bacterium]